MRGKAVGAAVLIVTLVVILLGIQYERQLEQQRNESIQQLMTLPPSADCRYEDQSLCPQAQGTVVLPDITGIGLVLLGILLGVYLIRSDRTHRGILQELSGKRQQLSTDERRELIYSVLTADERRVVEAVRQQPGITQATLRLRTDMSKAKLSMLLKDLEKRDIIRKVEDGKTNAVHLKREL